MEPLRIHTQASHKTDSAQSQENLQASKPAGASQTAQSILQNANELKKVPSPIAVSVQSFGQSSATSVQSQKDQQEKGQEWIDELRTLESLRKAYEQTQLGEEQHSVRISGLPDLNSTLFQNSERELFKGEIPVAKLPPSENQTKFIDEVKNKKLNIKQLSKPYYRNITSSYRNEILTKQQKERIGELYDKLAESNPKRFGTLVYIAKIKQLEAKRRLAFELAFKTPPGLPDLNLELDGSSFSNKFDAMFNDYLFGDVRLMEEVGAEFTDDDIKNLKDLYAELAKLNPEFRDMLSQYKAPS